MACAGPPPASPAADRQLDYVALGDSFAANPGVPDRAQPAECHRSTNDYPSVLAHRLQATTFTDVTCTGATTEDITDHDQRTMRGTVQRQIDAVRESTNLITITIGANDVGLAADADGCEVKGSNPAPCSDDFVVDNVDRVSVAIDGYTHGWSMLVDQLRAKAPHARVVLVGYGTLVRPGGCPGEQPILPKDSDYLQARLDELDDRQRLLAAEKGIEYFDTRPMTRGHDICAPRGERYVAGYEVKDPAVPMHPTASGAAAVGNTLAGYLRQAGKS